MQNTTDADTPNYFNGWVIASLFIGAIMMFIFFTEATESGDVGGLASFLYILIGISSLVYIGAFAVLLDQVKFGAILIIIGSIVLVPIGAVGMIGGLKILRQLKERDLPHNPLFEQDEKPSAELSAENFGQQFPLGLAMIIAGGLLLGTGGYAGGTLIGFGILNIALAIAAKNNSTIAFYPQFAKVRIALGSWRFIPYEDILDVINQGGKSLKIRHRQGEEEKEILLLSQLWGREKLRQIHEELQSKSQLQA